MFNKVFLLSIFLIISLLPQQVYGVSPSVELLDIKTGNITKGIYNSEEIQNETRFCLQSITGVSSKFNPIPKEGMLIKVPLEPPYQLENEWINDFISEVIIISNPKEDPLLVLHNDDNVTYFFQFEHSIDYLLELIKLQE